MTEARVWTAEEQAELLEICRDRFIDKGTHLENRYRYNNRVQVGERAGYANNKGYRQVKINGVKHQEHRLAWLMRHGAFPDDQIDHVDGDPLNQSSQNLRVVGTQDNARNMKRSRANSSGHTGVSWHKATNKWTATIKVDGKSIHLGLFGALRDAAFVRKAAERKYGYHANHGRVAS